MGKEQESLFRLRAGCRCSKWQAPLGVWGPIGGQRPAWDDGRRQHRSRLLRPRVEWELESLMPTPLCTHSEVLVG